MAKIEVSTSQVSDEQKPQISSYFEHDVPETLEKAVARFGEGPVYELFRGAYTVAIQAPARKELTAQWESLDQDYRSTLLVAPEKEDGQYTGTLPAEQQSLLQQRMDEWKLGEKSPRTRVVRVAGDPVQGLMAAWPNMSDEEKGRILAALGISLPTE